MKLRLLLALVIMPTLVLSTIFFSPTTASAACSYNGYVNSNGKCAVSWKPKPFATPNYNYSPQSIEEYIAYLYQLIAQLQNQVDDQPQFQSSVDVSTRPAVDVDTDSALLRGTIDLNNEDEAVVYFEYGRSRTDLDHTTQTRRIDEDDDEDFTISIKALRGNTYYYYRAVAKDDDGVKDYGSVLSFKTDEDDDLENPEVETKSATAITDDSADLRGTVIMHDFGNGLVFFVYGEDDELISDIADEYIHYDDIEEDGDDLQKVTIDSDLDNNASYTRSVSDLNPETTTYFAICVEYEDHHNDSQILCGDTKSFETNN